MIGEKREKFVTDRLAPCGCFFPQHICREAEHLWDRAAHFFEMSKERGFDDESWARYLEVLGDYKGHFGREV